MSEKMSEMNENTPQYLEEIKSRKQYKAIAEKKTRKFMKYVKAFLEEKNDGQIPNEFQASLMMLETYYKQFLQITAEMDSMDSIIITGRYGPQVTSLMSAQQTCSVRIESILEKFGMTMKSQKNLKINEPKEDSSPLSAFVTNNQIEKR